MQNLLGRVVASCREQQINSFSKSGSGTHFQMSTNSPKTTNCYACPDVGHDLHRINMEDMKWEVI